MNPPGPPASARSSGDRPPEPPPPPSPPQPPLAPPPGPRPVLPPAGIAPPPAAAGAGTPLAPPPGPRPAGERRRRLLILSAVAAIAIGAVVVIAIIASRPPAPAANPGPLRIGRDVAVRATPARGGCGTTFTFVATGSVSGAGRMVYRWEQSDGRTSPDLSVDIDRTVGSFALHQSWRFEGSQAVQGSMTFHVLRPDPRSATASIAYTCS